MFSTTIANRKSEKLLSRTDTRVYGWMINKWTMGMNYRGLYNGGDPPSVGDRKNIKRKILNEIYCSTVENKLSKIATSSLNLLLELIFDL